MLTFASFCDNLTPLTNIAINDLEYIVKEKTFKKGEYILHQERICRNLYFINSGLVKMFRYSEGKEFIMNFFREENMFTVLNSFPFQTPSEYNIIALESTSVQYISSGALEELCHKHHCIETFYRKILSHATYNMMHRIKEMLTQSHEDHYKQYLEDNHELVQRISLGDLACYLGISQVSLSRIRSRK